MRAMSGPKNRLRQQAGLAAEMARKKKQGKKRYDSIRKSKFKKQKKNYDGKEPRTNRHRSDLSRSPTTLHPISAPWLCSMVHSTKSK
jgi:hypothetical protein